jgi:UDP-glucose 4-epimerase
MRVFVTGGTGHLGAFVVRRFLKDRADVAVLMRSSANSWRISDVLPQLTIVPGDLANPQSYARVLADFAPQIVVHLGWSGVSAPMRNAAEQVLNVTAAVELLRVAKDSGCVRFVGVGSQAEYGRAVMPLDEDVLPAPDSMYGAAKLAACVLTRQLCHEWHIQFAWLRLLSTYGPMDNDEHLIPLVIRQLLHREKPLLTNGQQLWDYIYVEDAAEAIYRAGTMPAVRGMYNLASGSPVAVRTIVETIRDLIDPALPLGFGEKPQPTDETRDLTANIARLRSTAHWSAAVPLDEGLRRTVNYYRSREMVVVSPR